MESMPCIHKILGFIPVVRITDVKEIHENHKKNMEM